MRAELTARIVTVLAMLIASSSGAQVIDDFESYADTNAFHQVWSSGSTMLSTNLSYPEGTRSMVIFGVTSPGSGWSCTRVETPAVDLRGETLRIWFRRGAFAANPTGVALGLRDATNGHSCITPYLDVSHNSWTPLDLDTVTTCPALDMANIEEITAYTRNSTSTASDPTVNFDFLERFLFRDGFESGDPSAWSSTSP